MFSLPTRNARTVVLQLVTVCMLSVGLTSMSARWLTVTEAATTSDSATSRYAAPAQTATNNDILAPVVGNTITVNSITDVANSADGLCTLREAITAANTNVESGATPGECGAGSGTDSDTISLAGLAGTITLGSALPDISSDMTISGPGLSQLTISGDNNVRVFHLPITNPGPVSFSGLTISNGRADMDVGGGIYSETSAAVNVNACSISNNFAGLGGAIANSSNGTFTITNSTINNNSAGTAAGFYNGSGTLNIIGSTLSNNSTTQGGFGNGGGVNTGSGTLNVINSTLHNNTAFGGGGGIYSNSTDAVINVSNSTITQNFAVAFGGGGINNNNAGHSNILNSIIASNGSQVGTDLLGTFVSLGHNLIGNNAFSTGFTVGTNNPNGDLVGGPGVARIEPILGPLQNNGGATETRALLPGSPAIDAGDNCVVLASGSGGCLATPLTTDQRGVARQVNGTVDMGAFESRSFTLSATSGTPQSKPVNALFAALVVTASGTGGDPVAGGRVIFSSPTSEPTAIMATGTSDIQEGIDASGQANTRPTASGTAGGPYNVTATMNRSSSSASFSLTNTQAATATVLTSSANPSDLTEAVTFRATITPTNTPTGTPTGTVQFNIDGTPAGPPVSLSGGVAALTTSALTVGTHPVTADYSGDANFLASSGTLTGGQVVRTPPSLSIGAVSVTEGGGANMNFPVTLSAASNLTVSVNFATQDITATAPSDYVAANSTLTFTPGQTSRIITVTINGDVNFEPNETLGMSLSNPTNATINVAQATGTILNDDAEGGFIRFSDAFYNVVESAGQFVITVNRTNDTSRAATVDYATSDTGAPASCGILNGLASARCDFTSTSGTLRFAANETQKTFTVLVNQDSYVEGTETFTVSLSNLTGGAVLITPSSVFVRIINVPSGPPANLIDDSTFFVRQHYHDFLNREPDQAGLQFWVNQIEGCGADTSCRELKRINVSAAFFLSIEFQETGYLVYRFYKSAYGNLLGTPVPLRLIEFLPDTQQIGKGVVVGQSGWEQQLENNKVAFAQDFVSRSRFTTAYPTTMTPPQFVDALFANAAVTPSADDRNAAVGEFLGALNTLDSVARGRALRRVAENSILNQQEKNRAFVLMQYFGYLRRNPNDPPELNLDFGGYNFWLGKLNQFNGNFVDAEMVKAFIISSEYRQRFGP